MAPRRSRQLAEAEPDAERARAVDRAVGVAADGAVRTAGDPAPPPALHALDAEEHHAIGRSRPSAEKPGEPVLFVGQSANRWRHDSEEGETRHERPEQRA
jgi:hypothetical protein